MINTNNYFPKSISRNVRAFVLSNLHKDPENEEIVAISTQTPLEASECLRSPGTVAGGSSEPTHCPHFWSGSHL